MLKSTLSKEFGNKLAYQLNIKSTTKTKQNEQ